MFELNGYWQKVDGIISREMVRMFAIDAANTSVSSGVYGTGSSVADFERQLTVPTFIRRGKKGSSRISVEE